VLCWKSLWFLVCLWWHDFGIMSSAHDSLTSSFPMWIPFISCSCLIALLRNSKTILNRSGEGGQPCLVPDFKKNGFSHSPFNMMLALGLSDVDFIMLRNIHSIPGLFSAFIMKGCWILWKAFSVSSVSIGGSCCFCPCFILSAVLHLLIYVCWTILAFLEWY
jgi:hypothetical protein